MQNLIDFHIHGIGSNYKDSHATASYDHICAYFQKLANEQNRNFVIALTEHECSLITFDEYKNLTKKYPNVKIMLGMEINCKLSYATKGVFEKAHILAYADMSSDESIKKWLECPELKALSKINTFRIKFPTNYEKAKTFIDQINITFAIDLDAHKIANNFAKTEFNNRELKEKLCSLLAKEIYKNHPNVFDNCLTEKSIYNYLTSIKSPAFQVNSADEPLGNQLYVAKNLLYKHLGLKLNNKEIALILDKAKPRSRMRNEFLRFVRLSIEKRNPQLFNEIKDLSLEEFANYPIATNEHGSIVLNSFFPETSQDVKANLGSEIRIRLSEVNEIVAKTGGHLILAHPSSAFKYSKNATLTKEDFKLIDPKVLPKSVYENLKNKFKDKDSIDLNEFKEKEFMLIKLNLFFNLCKKGGINFDGYEIEKSNFNHPNLLLDKLIYAAKHDMDVSFGSDTHLSNLHYYYNLLQENKIDKKTFDGLCGHAYKIRDNTVDNDKFKILYGSKIKAVNEITRKANIVSKSLKNKDKRFYPYKSECKVLKTSFSDKMLGNKIDNKYKPMMKFELNGNVYEFETNKLKNMRYGFSTKKHNKKTNEIKNEETEM